MAHEIKVPSVGESVSEARIARWIKQDGETVAMDEPILELETDKANMELNADQAGVLKIQKAAGENVVPGEVIGLIEEGRKPSAKTEPHRDAGATTAQGAASDSRVAAVREQSDSPPGKSTGPALKQEAPEEPAKAPKVDTQRSQGE